MRDEMLVGLALQGDDDALRQLHDPSISVKASTTTAGACSPLSFNTS
ncbi:hypothetical protein [Caldalkalibacillus thermarum]|nr:hypothetical protein [Caldalkalibacillus thermarum]